MSTPIEQSINYDSYSSFSSEKLEQVAETLLNLNLNAGNFFWIKLEQIIQEKISFLLSIIQKEKLHTKRTELNPIFWHMQSQAILQRGLSDESIYSMLLEDTKHYVKEYILNEAIGSFEYQIGHSATSLGYEHTNIEEVCQHLVDQEKFTKQINRSDIEHLVFGQFLSEWLQKNSVNQRLVIISPPGTKKNGYLGLDSYAYVFVYEIMREGTNKKAHVDMYKRWLKRTDYVSILETLGKCKLKNFKKDQLEKIPEEIFQKLVLLTPRTISENVSNSEIYNFLNAFAKNTPDTKKEVFVEPTFWDDFNFLFDNFFWPKILPILKKEKLTNKDIQIFEFVLAFWQKSIENQKVYHQLTQTGQKKNNNPWLKQINYDLLENNFKTFINVQFNNLQINKEQAKEINASLAVLFSNIGGINALQQVLSITHCGIGTVPSLMLQGKNIATPLEITFPFLPEKKFFCPLCKQQIVDPCYCPHCSPILNKTVKSSISSNRTSNAFIKRSIYQNSSKDSISPFALLHSMSLSDFILTFTGSTASISMTELLAGDIP